MRTGFVERHGKLTELDRSFDLKFGDERGGFCLEGGVTMSLRIQVPKEELAAFGRRNRIRRLAFFGSVLRDDFTPESDVDVLVEFEPGVRVGLRFFALEEELSDLLGRKVDLNTPGFISKYFRDEVIAEAETAYVAA